jgi:hypothetical protein
MRNTHYAISSRAPLTVAGRRYSPSYSLVQAAWFEANKEAFFPHMRAGTISVVFTDATLKPTRVAVTAPKVAAAAPSLVDTFKAAVDDFMTADISEFVNIEAKEEPPAPAAEQPVAAEAEVVPEAGGWPGAIGNIAEIHRLEVYPSATLDEPDLADEPTAPGRTYPQHSDDELLTWKTSELRQLCEDNGVELKSYDTTKSRIIEKWRAAAGAPR